MFLTTQRNEYYHSMSRVKKERSGVSKEEERRGGEGPFMCNGVFYLSEKKGN